MKDDELLNAVFRFKHKTPSDRQEAATCVAFAKRFASFVADVEVEDVPEHQCGREEPLADDRVVPASTFAVHEGKVLQQLCQRLTASGGRHKRGDVWYDPWLPKYGCVVQRTQKSATSVKIEVVFVDSWERELRFLSTGECVHSAVPRTDHTLHCADLDSELEATFSAVFASQLREAELQGVREKCSEERVGAPEDAAVHSCSRETHCSCVDGRPPPPLWAP
ncbi:hypothetical protein PHYPSEUDO_010563 [Phytophthora pseudosyringae]|uniref:Uncharacterized protein n=1 Tax=Phytophthora pseudosyringae TaxID=221518 RepID=A0A8T1VAK2_9STRA|nr:hypothetical protein PHYPSEUDO_010563 [Phytophthora pseudosyringae]